MLRVENQDNPAAELKYLEIAPPPGQENRPPMVVSHVDVSGGADTLIITFYYVDQSTMRGAVSGEPTTNVERRGDKAIIRSEPIARVALPVTVALQLFGSAVDTITDGIPELQEVIQELGTKFASALQRFGSSQSSSSTEGEEDAG